MVSVRKTRRDRGLSLLLTPKTLYLNFDSGKSTLLQAISVGQYDKVPGDGRELCVSLSDAVTVRAEDGRYVNNWYVQSTQEMELFKLFLSRALTHSFTRGLSKR